MAKVFDSSLTPREALAAAKQELESVRAWGCVAHVMAWQLTAEAWDDAVGEIAPNARMIPDAPVRDAEYRARARDAWAHALDVAMGHLDRIRNAQTATITPRDDDDSLKAFMDRHGSHTCTRRSRPRFKDAPDPVIVVGKSWMRLVDGDPDCLVDVTNYMCGVPMSAMRVGDVVRRRGTPERFTIVEDPQQCAGDRSLGGFRIWPQGTWYCQAVQAHNTEVPLVLVNGDE